MNIYKGVFISALLFFSLNCCNIKNKKSTNLHEFKNTIEEFYSAINSGNSENRLSLFAPDAIIMPDGSKLIELNDSVKTVWKQYDENWVFRIKDLEHVKIEISGNIAYTVNTYYYTFHRKESEPQWHKTKNVHIWRKQEDNSWKLKVDIWNDSGVEE